MRSAPAAPEVRVQDGRVRGDLAALDQVDHARHRLPLVHRIGEHALEAGGEADRVERVRVGDPVGAGVVAVVEDDLVVAQLAADADQLRGPAGDPGDLVPGLLRPR